MAADARGLGLLYEQETIMILFDLLGLLIIGGLAWGVVSVVNWYKNKRDANRLNAKELRKELGKAETVLRRIANGHSGDPVLEASIALDEIERYFETKELT